MGWVCHAVERANEAKCPARDSVVSGIEVKCLVTDSVDSGNEAKCPATVSVDSGNEVKCLATDRVVLAFRTLCCRIMMVNLPALISVRHYQVRAHKRSVMHRQG